MASVCAARECWRAEGEMCAAILNHAASPIRPPHHVVQKEKSSKEKEKKLTVQPIRIAQVQYLYGDDPKMLWDEKKIVK